MALPNTTNYAAIQEDEIEVLRSIYMDDFQEEMPKIGAWNVCNNIVSKNHPKSILFGIPSNFRFVIHLIWNYLHNPDSNKYSAPKTHGLIKVPILTNVS